MAEAGGPTGAGDGAGGGGGVGVVHRRGGGGGRTGVGSFVRRLLEEVVLQGVERRDAALGVVVQHAQDQVWRRTSVTSRTRDVTDVDKYKVLLVNSSCCCCCDSWFLLGGRSSATASCSKPLFTITTIVTATTSLP